MEIPISMMSTYPSTYSTNPYDDYHGDEDRRRIQWFCCSTKTLALLSAIYTMILCVPVFIFFITVYISTGLVNESAVYAAISYGSLVAFGILSVCSVVLVIGIKIEKRILILPWLICSIFVILHDIISLGILLEQKKNKGETTTTQGSWDHVIIAFYMTRLILLLVSIWCVRRHIGELGAQKLNPQHAANENRTSSSTTESSTPIEPPSSLQDGIMLKPPPYCEVPLYSEAPPPPYSPKS